MKKDKQAPQILSLLINLFLASPSAEKRRAAKFNQRQNKLHRTLNVTN